MKRRKGLLNVLFVVVAMATGVALSMKPWKIYGEQRERAEQSQAQMQDAEKNREELTRLKARYENPVGREELARKQGYTKPGEQTVD